MPLSSSLILSLNNVKNHFFHLWLSIINNKTTGATRVSSSKKISISIAIVFMSFYYAYCKIILPPPQLRHLPRAGFFEYLNSAIKRRPNDQIYKEITYPLAAQTDHGLYAAFSMSSGRWLAFSTRPESVKKLLLKTDLFPKPAVSNAKKETLFGKFIMGPNIIFLPHGPQWKSQRSILNPAFHRSMPVKLFGELTQKLFAELDKEIDLGSVDVPDIMTRWTLDAIGIAGFDFDFNAIAEKDNEWVNRYHLIIRSSLDPLFLLLPFLDGPYWRSLFPKRKQLHYELDLFLEKMQEIITHKRNLLENSKNTSSSAVNEKINEKDLLTLMLEAAEDENGILTDEEIKSNLCGFFLAGHDTTANALSFAMYNLATHPDVQQKAREEAIKVLGDHPKDVFPTLEQIKEMPYIQMVIKETLRRNGVVQNIVGRKAAEDTELGGCVIPKGVHVTLDMTALHRNPLIWEDPDLFKPERFAPGGEAEKVAKKNGMSWVPFSSGARMCIGVNFSLNEQRVFLPMLLRKYELTLPDDSIHKEGLITSGIGLQKASDLKINLKKRY